jgi:hypothetical protein
MTLYTALTRYVKWWKHHLKLYLISTAATVVLIWNSYTMMSTRKTGLPFTICQILVSSSGILMQWLLDLHAPLSRYIKNDSVNPWFIFDIERAMVERDIGYIEYGKGGGETKTED